MYSRVVAPAILIKLYIRYLNFSHATMYMIADIVDFPFILKLHFCLWLICI